MKVFKMKPFDLKYYSFILQEWVNNKITFISKKN